MAGEIHTVNSEHTLKCFIDNLKATFKEHKYFRTSTYAGKRTLPANSLSHVWYGEIAKHLGDGWTANDAKCMCKLKYGISILRRDPMHNWVYEQSIDKLPYEKQIKLMETFAVTSAMSVDQMKEYMKIIQGAYPFLINQ